MQCINNVSLKAIALYVSYLLNIIYLNVSAESATLLPVEHSVVKPGIEKLYLPLFI